jgi:hypothetical protein
MNHLKINHRQVISHPATLARCRFCQAQCTLMTVNKNTCFIMHPYLLTIDLLSISYFLFSFTVYLNKK